MRLCRQKIKLSDIPDLVKRNDEQGLFSATFALVVITLVAKYNFDGLKWLSFSDTDSVSVTSPSRRGDVAAGKYLSRTSTETISISDSIVN